MERESRLNPAAPSPRTGESDRPDRADIAIIRALIESGSLANAQRHARGVLDRSPNSDPAIRILLATCLLWQGKTAQAVELRNGIEEDSLDGENRAEIDVFDARYLVQNGRWRDCIDRYGSVVGRPATNRHAITIGLNVAQAYARLYRPQTARPALNWVMAECRRLGWEEGEARGRLALALVARMEGQWQQAVTLLQETTSAFAVAELFRDYVKASLDLGLQWLFQGELEEADLQLAQVIRMASDMGDPRIEANARADRSLALIRLQRPTEARRELARAIRLSRRQASPRVKVLVHEFAGEVHLATGQAVPGERALRRALELARRIAPEGDLVPEILRRQAELALFQGKPEEALRLADEAKLRAEEVSDPYETAVALRVRGQALEAAGRHGARSLYRNALMMLERMGERFEAARIRNLLSAASKASSSEVAGETPEDGRFRLFLEISRAAGILGDSPLLLDVLRQASMVAPTPLSVMIQGETGTGKELLARAIHAGSAHPTGPFVPFNCATSTPDLLDAELFGHVRGAYTGAAGGRLGLVRAADHGTLFLDEIGELPVESQARLLRMLDSGEVRPLGADQPLLVVVRILAATHTDVQAGLDRGRFRQDLFYRLSGVRLCIPPLRHRFEDLELLVEHFTEEARHLVNPRFAGLSGSAIQAMRSHDWPGNIRELRHEVFRLATLNDGKPVKAWYAPPRERSYSLVPGLSDGAILQDAAHLTALLVQYRGRMSELARALGVSRSALYRALRRHGIDLVRSAAGREDSRAGDCAVKAR